MRGKKLNVHLAKWHIRFYGQPKNLGWDLIVDLEFRLRLVNLKHGSIMASINMFLQLQLLFQFLTHQL